MLEEYDPLQAPDPDEWLAMDEDERRFLVEEYHRDCGDEAPNPTLHALIHATVESQVALGDETPVAATLERLMRQGLDRHNASTLSGPSSPGPSSALSKRRTTTSPVTRTRPTTGSWRGSRRSRGGVSSSRMGDAWRFGFPA